MVSPNVNKIYQAVKTLTEAERDELRQLLDSRAKSFIDPSPRELPHPADLADERRRKNRRRDFVPIDLPGGLLSDDIIRDRR